MSYPAPAFPVKHPQPQAPGLEVRCVRAADPAAEVLITEMGYQYLARYGPGDMAGKAACKKALQERFGRSR